MVEWQLVDETTPPRKTDLLVYGPIWTRSDNHGKRDLSNWETPRIFIAQNIDRGICYVEAGLVDSSLAECKPTHWMLLPPPPDSAIAKLRRE